MIDLKPCPFCGQQPMWYQTGVGSDTGARVCMIYFDIRCSKCDLRSKGGYLQMSLTSEGEIQIKHDSRDTLAKWWNGRMKNG